MQGARDACRVFFGECIHFNAQRRADATVLSEVVDLYIVREIFGTRVDVGSLHAAGAGAWHARVYYQCPKTVRV